MFCRDWIVVKRAGDLFTAHPLYCRSWQCDVCQPRRCKQLVKDGLAGAPTTFITLTAAASPDKTPDEQAQQLVKAWREVVRRAKRLYGYKEIPYLAVFEATKQGRPHLHILCRVKWIGQDWLSRQMGQIMASPIVDIRRIRSRRGAALYVSKYVGKDPHRFQGVKRYWCTQGWRVTPKPDKPLDPGERGWPQVKEIDVITWQAWVESQGAMIHQEGPPLVYSFTVPP
jgi:hypothetical protein